MSDHLDAPNGSPGMDPRLDICDIFIFNRWDDSERTVIVFNVNPFAPSGADEFHPEAIYEILIDTNEDAIADISYRFTYTPKEHGRQLATVRVAKGDDARDIHSQGDIIFENILVDPLIGEIATGTEGHKLFIGMRSDPFFFDLAGYLGAMDFTGTDHFIDKNVFSMVLEMPNEALGSTRVGIWARVMAPQEGSPLTQIDRMGRPFINVAFIEDKNMFNQAEPTQDRELFLDQIIRLLVNNGRDVDDARQVALSLLPDILMYDTIKPARYPNGRTLSDDIIDYQLTLITNGRVTSDMVEPHDDLLDVFPYLGLPHPGERTIQELAEASQRRPG
ncbi:MAG: DUF4331 domain-containing protein [Euryarchaeota archaeon]|nr:DUF4331 domain-containing protein [Euryarchaeota archaeon]